MEEKAKEAFFEELYRLDQDSSEEEDQSNASVILRESKLVSSPLKERTTTSGVIHSSGQHPLWRTVSAPSPQASNPSRANLLAKSPSALRVSSKPSTQVIIDTPVMAKKAAHTSAQKEVKKATGKRKRGQSLELKPESQQIFGGLGFCRSHLE